MTGNGQRARLHRGDGQIIFMMLAMAIHNRTHSCLSLTKRGYHYCTLSIHTHEFCWNSSLVRHVASDIGVVQAIEHLSVILYHQSHWSCKPWRNLIGCGGWFFCFLHGAFIPASLWHGSNPTSFGSTKCGKPYPSQSRSTIKDFGREKRKKHNEDLFCLSQSHKIWVQWLYNIKSSVVI